MEGLLIMLLVFAGSQLIRWARNASNQTKRPANRSYPGTGTMRSTAAPEEKKPAFQSAPKFRGTVHVSKPQPQLPSMGAARPLGSLGVDTREGMDMYTPVTAEYPQEREEPRRTAPKAAQTKSALPIPLTANAMVQAVVMSEILARPSQRKWGRR